MAAPDAFSSIATEGRMTLFDSDAPLSDEEIEEVREYANERIRLWRKRAFYSVVALFLSCASVIPFSKGHYLHAHAEPFGRLFVCLSMAFSWCASTAPACSGALGRRSAMWRRGKYSLNKFTFKVLMRVY
jgi:hypothetical protein